jgi:mono/diheme cytochrome c family protein
MLPDRTRLHGRGSFAINAHLRIAVFVATTFVLGPPIWSGVAGQPPLKSGSTARGKDLYVRHCAACHGTEGKGDGYKLLGADPANFTSPSIKGKSDADLLKTIHEGKRNMPAWKVRLSDQQSRDVLAYIRTLSKP